MQRPSGIDHFGLPSMPDCTDDALLDGRVRLLQPARGYRVAVDAVLLAASVPLAAGLRIMDVGCGVGAAALCLLARAREAGFADIRLTGLEVQERLVELARQNAQRNGASALFDVVAGDVAAPPAGLGIFDHILTNPPYLPPSRADPSPDPGKALATVESTAGLAAWIAFCLRSLRPAGTLTLVHRADRKAEIVDLMRPHVRDITILPVLPQVASAPGRLIVRARPGKGGTVLAREPLVLHRPGGGYTEAADAILRHAGAVVLG
jgi:tRNA1(Val) A37 N6-methylase TrmN6